MLLKFEDLNQSIPLIGLLSKPHCKLSDGMVYLVNFMFRLFTIK